MKREQFQEEKKKKKRPIEENNKQKSQVPIEVILFDSFIFEFI